MANTLLRTLNPLDETHRGWKLAILTIIVVAAILVATRVATGVA